MKNPVAVPTTGQPCFRFRHSFAFESDLFGNYNTGVVSTARTAVTWTGCRGAVRRQWLRWGEGGNPAMRSSAAERLRWCGPPHSWISPHKGHTVLRPVPDCVGRTGRGVGVVRRTTCSCTPARWGPVDTPTPTATVTLEPTATPTATRTPDPNLTKPVVHACDGAVTFPLMATHAAAGGGALRRARRARDAACTLTPVRSLGMIGAFTFPLKWSLPGSPVRTACRTRCGGPGCRRGRVAGEPNRTRRNSPRIKAKAAKGPCASTCRSGSHASRS